MGNVVAGAAIELSAISKKWRFAFRAIRLHHRDRVKNCRLVHVADEGQHFVGEAVWCDEMCRVPVPIEGSEATVR